MSELVILHESCTCGAATEVAVTFQSEKDTGIAHAALAAWRLNHQHEPPARNVVRIPLARRRA